MRVLITLVLTALVVASGCQTPPPPTPATSTDLAGPAPKGTVLQRAGDGAQLFPAKEGAGGHDHHHHHAPAAAPAPAPAPSMSTSGGGR